jgi:hypothetical protein
VQPQLKATPTNGIGWEAMRPVFRDASIGGSTALAMAWLWESAGRRPATIVVTPVGLGAEFGRSARSAWDWLENLVEHRLIEILDRDPRRGTITLYVFDPRDPETCRVRPADPQKPLPGMEDEPGGSGVSAQKPPTPLKLAGVSAQKPPTETICAGVSAQKPPTENGDDDGSAVGKPHAGAGARAKYQIPKNKEVYVPILPKTKYQEPSDAAARAAAEEGADGPRPFAALVAPAIELAIDRMANPERQANRLAARILDAVPELVPTGEYLADYAARLVAIERRLEFVDLNRLLGHVRAMRRAKTITGNAGALFNALLKKRLKELGIPWCPNGEYRQRE